MTLRDSSPFVRLAIVLSSFPDHARSVTKPSPPCGHTRMKLSKTV